MRKTMEIVSHETIKPCSPTPPSLSSYKLSHMDQLCPYQYVPYLLFYNSTTTSTSASTEDDHIHMHGRVKNALAETLTYMYPLAGRANDDGMTIDCNDHGVEFIVTHINEDIMMSAVLQSPNIHFLRQLLPLSLSPTWRNTTSGGRSQPLVAIQINHFGCGGVAVGACIRHNMADASAASAFLQIWACIARGDRKYVPEEKSRDLIIFAERTTVFPPEDDLDDGWKEDHRGVSQVNKLLVFEGSKVAALKENIGLHLEKNPTRVLAVTAFLWAALISTARERNQQLEMHVMTTPVNLRNKMDPPLPAYSMGNIYHATSAVWDQSTKTLGHAQLVQKLKKSVDMVTEDFARKIHGNPDFMNKSMAGVKLLATSQNLEAFVTSSWCGFPFYDIDFGWGKPIWVATLAPPNNMGLLLDAGDGAGVQAWLSLRKEDMDKLEKDPSFLAYISCIHTL